MAATPGIRPTFKPCVTHATLLQLDGNSRPMPDTPSYNVTINLTDPRIGELMATVQQISDQADAVAAAVNQLQVRVDEDFAEVRRLLEQASVDQATIDAVAAKLDQVKTAVDAVDPDPNFPPPQP